MVAIPEGEGTGGKVASSGGSDEANFVGMDTETFCLGSDRVERG